VQRCRWWHLLDPLGGHFFHGGRLVLTCAISMIEIVSTCDPLIGARRKHVTAPAVAHDHYSDFH